MFVLSVITVFQLRSFWKVGFLPAVYNQGLFVLLLLVSVINCLIFRYDLRARAGQSASHMYGVPSRWSLIFWAPITRQEKKWGGRKGQRGGVLGSPFPGFRAFTKQGLLKFLLSSCVTSSNLPGSVVCVCFQILVNLLLATLLIY